MKTTVPIVFSFDNKYALPASVAIQSLIDTKSVETEYDIFVLHRKLSKCIMKKMEKIHPINWIKVDRKFFKKVPKSKEYPEVVYYRMLIHELIPQYDKIIWSDVDVLFKKDLAEVFNTSLDDYFWGGVAAEVNHQHTAPCIRTPKGETKPVKMSGHTKFAENENKFIFMSGFMLINSKKMRECNMTSKFFEVINNFHNRLVMFDLEVLNLACNKIKPLPFDYCVLENVFDEDCASDAPEYPFLNKIYTDEELLNAKKNPAIIHYTGKNIRIWNRAYKHIPLYYRIYIINSPFYDRSKYFPIAEFVRYLKISLRNYYRKVKNNFLIKGF